MPIEVVVVVVEVGDEIIERDSGDRDVEEEIPSAKETVAAMSVQRMGFQSRRKL